MKNYLKIILLSITLIILSFLVYKIILLQKYTITKINIDNKAIFNQSLKIKPKPIKDSITYEEMTYQNYFSDYIDKDNSNIKVKYDNNNEISSFYSIAKEKQYIYLLDSNSLSLNNGKDELKTDKKIINKYLKNNNIKNDIDLLQYIKNNYYLNNNIFTSANTMKGNYIINLFAQVALPGFTSITLIKGNNIKGYIIETKFIKEIHLLHNTNQYIITLSGKELTNNKFICNLLGTISFK